MDRADLSAAIIADAGETVMTLLGEALPRLMSADLASLEHHLQVLGRVLWGHVVDAIIGARAQDEGGAPCCATCGRPMRRVEAGRPRRLQGLVGDYTLRRAYDHCAACGQGQAPLDAALGVGRGALSPALRRVVCRAGVEEAFAAAAEVVQEAVGVGVSADSVERATERRGAVAEAAVQEAVGRVKQGQAAWPAPIEAPPTSGMLAVEVDGVQVQRDDGWHEMTVVTVAPLGPPLHHDRASGRTHWAWGAASYGAGFEEAEDFWYRAYVAACRRGLGTPAVQTVVVLGDGAEWIWHRAATFLGVGGVEVVEIVDIYHAYEYLWAVGHALFGVGTPEAVRWVEALKDQLYEQGVAPDGVRAGGQLPTARGGRRGRPRRPRLRHHASRAHGLSALCSAPVPHRLGGRGERVQESSRSAGQTSRHALESPGCAEGTPPTCAAPRWRVGRLLADTTAATVRASVSARPPRPAPPVGIRAATVHCACGHAVYPTAIRATHSAHAARQRPLVLPRSA